MLYTKKQMLHTLFVMLQQQLPSKKRLSYFHDMQTQESTAEKQQVLREKNYVYQITGQTKQCQSTG